MTNRSVTRFSHNESHDNESLLQGCEGIQCMHCMYEELNLGIGGFVNPKSTTVCRECNCVLRQENIVNTIVS